jgi:hypothetical protein
MRRLVIAGLLLCCWCGCADRDGGRAAVKGKVTLDGVAIGEEGATATISFFPTGATKGPAAGGQIQGGQYSIAASQGPAVGRNRVEIHASKMTGRKVADVHDGHMMDEMIEIIPARYNSESTLQRELKPGHNTLDFELSTR